MTETVVFVFCSATKQLFTHIVWLGTPPAVVTLVLTEELDALLRLRLRYINLINGL
jgi:hypothetical protein